MLTQFSVWYL